MDVAMKKDSKSQDKGWVFVVFNPDGSAKNETFAKDFHGEFIAAVIWMYFQIAEIPAVYPFSVPGVRKFSKYGSGYTTQKAFFGNDVVGDLAKSIKKTKVVVSMIDAKRIRTVGILERLLKSYQLVIEFRTFLSAKALYFEAHGACRFEVCLGAPLNRFDLER